MMIQSKFGRKSKVAEKSNEDSLNTRRRMNKNVKESKNKKHHSRLLKRRSSFTSLDTRFSLKS